MTDEVRESRSSAGEVGADSESLILVDEADREVGHLSKAECHHGRGVLHRAFSLLIFNGDGELLLQQRAASKRLWPLYWSNSCCSHPRRAESMETAIHRRLREELGVRCPLQFLFKFQYQAQFDAAGAEQELCSVFIGRCRPSWPVAPKSVHRGSSWSGHVSGGITAQRYSPYSRSYKFWVFRYSKRTVLDGTSPDASCAASSGIRWC
jgi:isopentenyl-diphosphate delta-isomerase type 1